MDAHRSWCWVFSRGLGIGTSDLERRHVYTILAELSTDMSEHECCMFGVEHIYVHLTFGNADLTSRNVRPYRQTLTLHVWDLKTMNLNLKPYIWGP